MMSEPVSRQIKLFGTDAPVTPLLSLAKGRLSLQYDEGALRYIKIDGIEAIRNIAFVVRNRDWGTYVPTISDLVVEEHDNGFTLTYTAVCKTEQQSLSYSAKIEAHADGNVAFDVSYHADTDFETNRTGFVVLHPIAGVAGQSVIVDKTDGTREQATFPAAIDPKQPFKDIRALTHTIRDGVSMRCEMLGDTFEMEDHRQWNDASYKTYVRPLALPWPYTIEAGETGQQSVNLIINSTAEIREPVLDQQGSYRIVVGGIESSATMPAIGLGLEPPHLQSAGKQLSFVKKLAVQQLVLWFDLSTHAVSELSAAGDLATACQAELVLHAVIPDGDYRSEIRQLRVMCDSANVSPSAICVSPALYLKSWLPDDNWPDVTPLSAIYDETRKHFPDSTIGGGMLAFFTELNRHRPPVDHLDYVTHASNTMTHASDDITVMENLEALPQIIDTCRQFSGGKPYRLGPSSPAMRFNPYGSTTMANPDNERIAMTRMDPRQRGLFCAAWTLGYVAHAARGGIDVVSLHAPTGEFGVIYHPESWQQPGFDNNDRVLYPNYHVVRGLAEASGRPQVAVQTSNGRDLQAIAYANDHGITLWLTNLTEMPITLHIDGLSDQPCSVSELSLDNWDRCTVEADALETEKTERLVNELSLSPYAVIKIETHQN